MNTIILHNEEDGKMERKTQKTKHLQGSQMEMYRKWQYFGVTKSPNLQLDITSVPTNYLEGLPEESLFLHLTTNVSACSLDATGTLIGIRFYGQIRQKYLFFFCNKMFKAVKKELNRHYYVRWRISDVDDCYKRAQEQVSFFLLCTTPLHLMYLIGCYFSVFIVRNLCVIDYNIYFTSLHRFTYNINSFILLLMQTVSVLIPSSIPCLYQIP